MLNKCKLIVVFGLVAGLAACTQPVSAPVDTGEITMEPTMGGKYK